MPESSRCIYGLHAVAGAIAQQPQQVQEVVILQGRQDRRLQALFEQARATGLRARTSSAEAFERLLARYELLRVRHQGVLALLTAAPVLQEADLAQLLDELTTEPLLLVLDGVTDPHNLGACLRSCDAAGATALIVPKDKSATLTATAVHVASGAAATVPLFAVTNLARTLKELQARGIWIYGTAGEASANLFTTDLRGPLALVMGTEGKGLRRLTREHCDHLVQIPMAGKVESLNVAVAAGVCLFEVVRQRAAL